MSDRRQLCMSFRGLAALLSALFALTLLSIPGFSQGRLNHYAVYLSDAPVTARYSREALGTLGAVSYRQQIEARQSAVTRELQSRRIPVTGAVTTLLNAVFIATTEDRIAEVESIPGVSGVRRLPPALKRFLNKATAAGGAAAAWTALGGQSKAGAGIKIGVLDTGIDQTHPAFQDSSLTMPAGFPKCTTGHPEDCAFTNSKVIVARSYVRQIVAANEADPKNPAADSMPDDYSPRDRTGHGTALASAAAGNITSAPAVGISGMAPKAYLGNYKIWGTEGVNDYPSTDVWIQALNDAVSDGMDVINLSDGGPAFTGALNQGVDCGLPAVGAGQQPNYCDPLAA
ncbi:MAG TPA: S8 family serine peptidase, partial [Candidatus Sulfopaludibacter sp.]|nr:S8 family serine peptidase [Candidatus Sulfopaludibacter sp.]